MYLLKGHEHENKFKVGRASLLRSNASRLALNGDSNNCATHTIGTLRFGHGPSRRFLSSAFLVFCFLSLGLVFFLGRISFPQWMPASSVCMCAGGQLRMKKRPRLCDEVENYVRTKIPKG